MLDALRSLPGAVEHVVAPSLSPEHWLYVNATAAAFPDATVWVCPGEPWQLSCCVPAAAALSCTVRTAGHLLFARLPCSIRAAAMPSKLPHHSQLPDTPPLPGRAGLTEVNLPGIGDAKISAGPRVRTIGERPGGHSARCLQWGYAHMPLHRSPLATVERGPLAIPPAHPQPTRPAAHAPGPDLSASLGGEVDYAQFVGPFGLFKEAVFYARNARAVFSGDLFFGAFEDEGMPSALQKRIGGVVGIYKRIGCPVAFLQMLLKRDDGREWASKVAGWDFDTVTGGHLSAGINKERYGVDGREAFLESFKFVLQ
jgi:hypothetical protein